jgi:Ca2+-binding RTX toxin-like protein
MANYGDDGNNLLKGAAGADELYAGPGNDLILGAATGATIEGDGSAGNPYANAAVPGPSGNDIMDGGSGRDALYGFDGDDVIYGGEGDDGDVQLFGASHVVNRPLRWRRQ